MIPSHFYASIIDRVFKPLTLGQMTMVWPDGSRHFYGQQPHGLTAVIEIKDWNFFKDCVLFGDIGFGESFVKGHWQTPDLTAVIQWMILNIEDHPTLTSTRMKIKPVNWLSVLNKIIHALRPNSLTGSRQNIIEHYDLGNDFFKLFLDETMAYSSAYFTNEAQTLEQAQQAKYELCCRKLRLSADDHVLEIGSGWGGFAIYAAKHFGSKVTTITISHEQYRYTTALVKQLGLANHIEVRLIDYRQLQGSFDKIISIEMIEAVGHRYLPVYFDQIQRLLKPQGVCLLQMIICPDHRYDHFRMNVDWIQKHIFPGSLLPSLKAVHEAINRTGELNFFDLEDMSPSYVKTLSIWQDRFNDQQEALMAMNIDESFRRKWNYYLSYCQAAFAMRNIGVVQAVFTRPNNYSLS